jgi:protocatechuate 3,4-dioxygenase beta subunit
MLKSSITLAALLAAVSLLQLNPLFASGLILAQAESGSGSGEEKKRKLIDLWQSGDTGERMNIRGRVTSIDGSPLAGVPISIRQADGNGDYSENYRTTLISDDKGRFQFGSVVPGNYFGARHVHIEIYTDQYEYYDTSILFKTDPNLDEHYSEGQPIFLEESTVNGESILFGRFDIVLTPM